MFLDGRRPSLSGGSHLTGSSSSPSGSSWGMSFWGCNRRKEADRTVVTIDGYQEVPQNEEALLQAVTHQPISVSARMQMFVHSSFITTVLLKRRSAVSPVLSYLHDHCLVRCCCRSASVLHRL